MCRWEAMEGCTGARRWEASAGCRWAAGSAAAWEVLGEEGWVVSMGEEGWVASMEAADTAVAGIADLALSVVKADRGEAYPGVVEFLDVPAFHGGSSDVPV